MLDYFISALSDFLYILPIYLISLTFHEYSHGFVAYKLGDPTAKDSGRLSLNPLKHLDPIGLLMMIFVRVGYAKPVPVNPLYFRNPKKGMMLTALAGPVSNLILAFISAFFCQFFLYAFINSGTELTATVYTFFFLMTTVNIGLAVFNLIPIHPFDGSRVLGYFMPNSYHQFMMNYGQYVYIAFFVFLIATDYVGNAISTIQGFLIGPFLLVWDIPAKLLASLIF